jgi:hypothetical protein
MRYIDYFAGREVVARTSFNMALPDREGGLIGTVPVSRQACGQSGKNSIEYSRVSARQRPEEGGVLRSAQHPMRDLRLGS